MKSKIPSKQDKIIFDACIFMVEIGKCSFQEMRETFIDALFNYFEIIYIHEVVYKDELDAISRSWISKQISSGKVVILKDPKRDTVYDELLFKLEHYELLQSSCRRKNNGEIHSIAYAKYYNYKYFSTNDRDAAMACNEIPTFSNIKIAGLEILLVLAELNADSSNVKESRKRRKAIYKSYCRRKGLPKTFGEYYKSILG